MGQKPDGTFVSRWNTNQANVVRAKQLVNQFPRRMLQIWNVNTDIYEEALEECKKGKNEDQIKISNKEDQHQLLDIEDSSYLGNYCNNNNSKINRLLFLLPYKAFIWPDSSEKAYKAPQNCLAPFRIKFTHVILIREPIYYRNSSIDSFFLLFQGSV